MMNLDMARAGEGVVSSDKLNKRKDKPEIISSDNNPLFQSEERKLNIEVPEGWKTVES